MEIAKKIIEDLQKEAKLKPQNVASSYLGLVEFFPLNPLMTNKQYKAALIIAERLLNVDDEGVKTYLQAITELISDYERKTFVAPKISGREMLAYLMELKGLTQKDIASDLGGQPNVSKILKGERDLNLGQIRRLSMRFKVEPSVFI